MHTWYSGSFPAAHMLARSSDLATTSLTLFHLGKSEAPAALEEAGRTHAVHVLMHMLMHMHMHMHMQCMWCSRRQVRQTHAAFKRTRWGAHTPHAARHAAPLHPRTPRTPAPTPPPPTPHLPTSHSRGGRAVRHLRAVRRAHHRRAHAPLCRVRERRGRSSGHPLRRCCCRSRRRRRRGSRRRRHRLHGGRCGGGEQQWRAHEGAGQGAAAPTLQREPVVAIPLRRECCRRAARRTGRRAGATHDAESAPRRYQRPAPWRRRRRRRRRQRRRRRWRWRRQRRRR